MRSARRSSFTASRLRSTPGRSSNRKSKRDGVGVGLVMTASTPWAAGGAASPASLPSPSPSGFTWVVRQTRWPGQRLGNAAGGSGLLGESGSIMGQGKDERRNGRWERQRPLPPPLRCDRLLPRRLRVPAPVEEVDREADRHPDDEPGPGVHRKPEHQVDARQDAERSARTARAASGTAEGRAGSV